MTSKSAQDIIDQTQKVLMKTYVQQPVVMDRGEGCYAWDTDGKKYLDFAIGIAVASLGHANPAILDTIKKQSSRIMAVQSSYATKEKLECAQLLVDNSCFDSVYFSNSGTESIEGAMKMVRKWGHDHKGEDCKEIIAFRKSFHGRTYGAASMTEKRFTQPYFAPYVPAIQFAEFNNLESVEKLISNNTCAIFVEPVQGESGVVPATEEFLKGLRTLCDEHKIALVFDEVQSGMGRIGKLFAYQSYGVEPDMATLAKGLGGGFPVGAIVAKKQFGEVIQPGTHGTTYGGNPLATAVAATVLKEMLKPGFMDNVMKTSEALIGGLKKLQRETNKITDVRGRGLMIGIDTTIEIKKFIRAVQSNGLMTTQAGDDTMRLTPPLIATPAHAEEAVAIIKKTLEQEE